MVQRPTANTKHHPERANARLKLIDRTAGIPLVYVLGLMKRFTRNRRSVPAPVKKAAVLQTAAIGDTVLSSALVQDIRRAYPACFITFFTGGSNYDTALLIPGIDRVVKLSVTRPLESIRSIRDAGCFDLWIDCGPWPRLNAVFSFFSRAAVTVGFRTRGQHRHYGYDLVVQHSSSHHELDNYRSLLKAAGIPAGSMPVLSANAPRDKNRSIVVHMFPGGSRSYLKVWPEEHWRELVTRFLEDGFEILLTGAEANRGQAESFRNSLARKEQVTVLAGKTSLSETVHVLAAARLVVSVDTGIMHIASAIGANLVSLHGPTSPQRWGPLNANAIAVSVSRSCSPCISLGFDSSCQDPQCMIQLRVDDVYGAANRLLQSSHKPAEQAG